MVKDIVLNKYYKINFKDKYAKYGPYVVQINAISVKSSLYLYGKFNIREEFFSEDGLKTYLLMVTEETPIYVCNVVKSYKPLEIDDKEPVFIPKTIIDIEETEEMLPSDEYSINLTGLIARFDTIQEKLNFIESLRTEIPLILKKSNLLYNEQLHSEISEETTIISKSVLVEKERLRENAREEQRRIQFNEENKIVQREKRALDAIERLNEQKKELIRMKEIELDSFKHYSEVFYKIFESLDEHANLFNSGDERVEFINKLFEGTSIAKNDIKAVFKFTWKRTLNDFINLIYSKRNSI